MKFELIFKTPDVLDLIHSKEPLPEVTEIIKKYVRFGELITIEFDTELGSAKVKEVS